MKMVRMVFPPDGLLLFASSAQAVLRPSRRSLRSLLRMRWNLSGTKKLPHPEEAAPELVEGSSR
ncbi:MAG: hypothetical protein ACREE7_17050, partial [Dongiaceae bacterium]